jgi:hypothetical protein
MRLAVLCPSRGRPELARKMEESFPCDVFFYLNADDPRLDEYNVEHREIGPDAPIGFTTNLLWMQNPGYDAYMFCGDDAVCRSDNIVESLAIRASAYPDGIWAAGVSDDREKGSFPHPIVGAGWAKALGYMVPPIFLHWHIDTRTEALAREVGRFIDLSPTVTVEHQTPKTGKNPVDDTFRRIRSGSWHARDAFVSNFEQYFEADLLQLKAALG